MKFDNLKEFESNLNVYTKGKSNFYQYRAKTPFFVKTYHVGKYNREKIPEYYFETLRKISGDMLHSLLNRKYISNILEKEDFFQLDIIRFVFYLGLGQFSKSEIEKYEEREFTRYVYGTTSIEGNTYTLRDTDITLNENQTIDGKSIREFHEINNYRNLREFMKEKKHHKISLDLIRTIHRFVLDNIDDESAGNFRNILVGIRGSNFTPSPPNVIEQELEELITEYDSDIKILHPVESIARFHQRFEEIHPFIDGNGRVGREIMRIQLQSQGYPFLYIGKEHRNKYLKALDAGNDGEYSELVNFIAKLILAEFLEHAKYLHQSLEGLLNSKEFRELIEKKDLPISEESLKNFEELMKYIKYLNQGEKG